eukprot:TRINITY_DN379_c0_g1_i1.p1 TRINITY_DN379_c0_g1~~TRINITY_DN379_c0_g1_i1.p1  ORF type:complete len:194 (-),score=62.60 TRINITY_DN379_c0_g1_i1:167-670(-)
MEILSMEWAGQPGACWEVWKLEPCCGEPCNPADGVRCFLCWCCPIVGLLSAAKLYSSTQDQPCSIVNHCLPYFIPYVGGILAGVSTRHNTRVKNGFGLPAGDVSGMVGDGVLLCFCGPCTFGQLLRATKNEDWDWIKEVQEKGISVFVDPCMFCIDGKGDAPAPTSE